MQWTLVVVSGRVNDELEDQAVKTVQYFEDLTGGNVTESPAELLSQADPFSPEFEAGRFVGNLYIASKDTPIDRVAKEVMFWKLKQDICIFSSIEALGSEDIDQWSFLRLAKRCTEVHFSEEDVVLKESELSRIPETTESHTGRPPLGFETENGQRVPGDNYETVCAVLQSVEDGRLSKRQAAEELDCVRATIINCLNRPEMYNIDNSE